MAAPAGVGYPNRKFQSLVYWKGGDKSELPIIYLSILRVSILGLLEGWG